MDKKYRYFGKGTVIKKGDESFKTKNLGGVAFVPLRGKYGFK